MPVDRLPPSPAPLPRGVYEAPWRLNGYPVLYAVTSTGERLKSIVTLRKGVSRSCAIRWLEQLLDRHDPAPPPLRLVKPPPGPKQVTMEQLDALYRDANPVDALFWMRKREKLRGANHPAPLRRLSS